MTDDTRRRAVETHELKCWPEYFQAILEGVKTFEIRLNDRDYCVNDTLFLREYDQRTGIYSGRSLSRTVVYMTEAWQQDGVVVMGLADSAYGQREYQRGLQDGQAGTIALDALAHEEGQT